MASRSSVAEITTACAAFPLRSPDILVHICTSHVFLPYGTAKVTYHPARSRMMSWQISAGRLEDLHQLSSIDVAVITHHLGAVVMTPEVASKPHTPARKRLPCGVRLRGWGTACGWASVSAAAAAAAAAAPGPESGAEAWWSCSTLICNDWRNPHGTLSPRVARRANVPSR